MGMLLAFAPFIAFAVIDRLVGSMEGLFAGALVATVLLLRDVVSQGRVVKILDLGTFILFCGLALYAYLLQPNWSIIAVRLFVDSGLLAIVLLSLAIGKPFTLQYAREQVSAELWDTTEFYRTNVVISLAWALAFGVMVAAELALLYLPDIPHRAGVIAIILALVGAVKFTSWYPETRRNAARP
ncbi:hypothetical protein [Bradyrhizobium sp.]|jgi:hypothetical protein|uniref:hypothetical protein n=1 Tax=Bradyrhizobium sp. TaxID=376 RepID=UPI002DDC9563|nr:hypothetical protein [Bradyrhizobium sp.]HEV2159388.1 hypothetical protein [Bradyrhizobium sp.]